MHVHTYICPNSYIMTNNNENKTNYNNNNENNLFVTIFLISILSLVIHSLHTLGEAYYFTLKIHYYYVFLLLYLVFRALFCPRHRSTKILRRLLSACKHQSFAIICLLMVSKVFSGPYSLQYNIYHVFCCCFLLSFFIMLAFSCIALRLPARQPL